MPARLSCRLALALALALGACGKDQPATAPAGPDQPVVAPADPAAAPGPEPASARSCRRLGTRLIGSRLDAATALASRRGCALRVAVRDGRALALTEDFQPARINVRLRAGTVAGVEFMG